MSKYIFRFDFKKEANIGIIEANIFTRYYKYPKYVFNFKIANKEQKFKESLQQIYYIYKE